MTSPASAPIVPCTDSPHLVRQAREEARPALDEILMGGRYVLGPEPASFESEVAAFIGAKHVLGVSNRTDALHLALRAPGIGPGDEVITAPNSCVASAPAIALAGAAARFADVGADMNMDPEALAAAITSRTRAVIPVHLTGRAARMDEIMAIARSRDLVVLEDCAQAVGAKRNSRPVGSWADVAAFSRRPLKNLFALGDSGFLATNDDALYRRLWRSRNRGMTNRGTCGF